MSILKFCFLHIANKSIFGHTQSKKVSGLNTVNRGWNQLSHLFKIKTVSYRYFTTFLGLQMHCRFYMKCCQLARNWGWAWEINWNNPKFCQIIFILHVLNKISNTLCNICVIIVKMSVCDWYILIVLIVI